MIRRWQPLLMLTAARLRELTREPAALFWVFAFPVLVLLALGTAFRDRPLQQVGVAVTSPNLAARLGAGQPLFTVTVLPLPEALARLRRQEVALVVHDANPPRVWHDANRPDGLLARALLEQCLSPHPVPIDDQPLPGRGWRYVNFLVPGLIALGLMGGGLAGVGFVLVDLRRRQLLKRLRATPLSRSEILLSLLLSRFVFLIPEVAILLLVALLVFDVAWQGSTFALLSALAAGASVFLGLGLLLAARIKALEAISGWISVLMLAQWLLCGVFFPVSVYPEAIQPWLRWLPLTPVVTGLRAVFTEEAAWSLLAPELLRMAVWTLATFAAGLWLFDWDQAGP